MTAPTPEPGGNGEETCDCGHSDSRHMWFGEHPCGAGHGCHCAAFRPAAPPSPPTVADQDDGPRAGPGGCHAALTIRGEHHWCDSAAPHDGWPHGSTAAEAIWRGAGVAEDRAAAVADQDDARELERYIADHAPVWEVQFAAGPGTVVGLSDAATVAAQWFAARRPTEGQRAEDLAQRFHETYERLAPDYGYSTREATAVPWDEVPEQNRALMIAVCAELLDGGDQ